MECQQQQPKEASKAGQGSANYRKVVELLEQSDAEYQRPLLPFPRFPPALEEEWLKNGPPSFGSEMKKLFHFKESTIFLNHGSYGAMPRPVKETYLQWLAHVEEQPCQWYNNELFPHIIDAVRLLAKFVGANPREMVFSRNATTAINAILRSFPFNAGDAVLCMNYTYGAIKKTLQYLLPRQQVDLVEIQIDYPPTGKQVIEKVKEAFEKDTNKKLKLVLLDQILSPLGLVLPMKELVQLSHEHGSRVLVDGAHVVGQAPLNLSDLAADYFVTNCHKWLYAPRGCAFAWVNEKYHNEVKPTVISHGYDQGFCPEFIWQATDDYTPFVSISSALRFVELCGADKIMSYTHDLANWAAYMLAKEWNTEVLVPSDFAALALIRMPKPSHHSEDAIGADNLSQLLWKEFQIEAMIFPLPKMGLVVRIAAQIYLERQDFIKFAESVKKLQEQDRY